MQFVWNGVSSGYMPRTGSSSSRVLEGIGEVLVIFLLLSVGLIDEGLDFKQQGLDGHRRTAAEFPDVFLIETDSYLGQDFACVRLFLLLRVFQLSVLPRSELVLG